MTVWVHFCISVTYWQVYWGTAQPPQPPQPTAAAHGLATITRRQTGTVVSTVRAAELPGHNHRVEVVGGIREDECRELMQTFFKERRSAARSS